MILLDSDHLTVLRFREGERCRRLVARLEAAADPLVGTTIVNVEETMRGWLANIVKERQVARQVIAYHELSRLFEFFDLYHIAPFDTAAAEQFGHLRAAKVRIGTMDLKVASVALAHGDLLLTANRRDFEQVPGLRFENWAD